MASVPSSMRIWRYTTAAKGIENNLTLHTSQPLPKPKPDQHLVQVLATGLNPVDYKPAEAGYLGSLLIRKPATPGFDIAGRIVIPADGSDLEPGQIVFGTASTSPFVGGGLAEYIAAPAATICLLPSSISPLHAAGIPVAAVTAYQSIQPFVHQGSRVFINGGSGGTGTFGIQIAKALGAHVTVSCSGRNIDLCRSLGADEIFDYNASPLLKQLASVTPFDHIVDNVGHDSTLFYQAHTYTNSSAKFIEVGSSPSLSFVRFALGALLWPSLLGGGRRKFVLFGADIKREPLEKIASWMSEGKVKTVNDQVFAMDDAVQAYKHLKTGRATGKVIVDVAGEGR